jgi:hypothetical protein
LVVDGAAVALATVDGRLLLRTVRPAGGRDMPADAWLRGAGRDVVGTAVVGERGADARTTEVAGPSADAG